MTEIRRLEDRGVGRVGVTDLCIFMDFRLAGRGGRGVTAIRRLRSRGSAVDFRLAGEAARGRRKFVR